MSQIRQNYESVRHPESPYISITYRWFTALFAIHSTPALASVLNIETWFEKAEKVLSYADENQHSFADSVSLELINLSLFELASRGINVATNTWKEVVQFLELL